MVTRVHTLLLLCLGCFAAGGVEAKAVDRVILDTDFRTDCDDVGALAMLHALADAGECELLGVIASTTGPHVVAAIDAVNTWYGRGAIPIGLSPKPLLPEGAEADNYAPALADRDRFPSTLTNEAAPDSTTLYRKLLHAAPDGSVTIVVVGAQTCIALLLESAADHEGDGSIGRSGRDLIRAKVRELVVMGGDFGNPHRWEFNIKLDVKAADTVAREWPGPIVYSGFEVGDKVMTGGRLQNPAENPVALAYQLSRHTGGGVGKLGARQSWDQTAVYYAVRGLGSADAPLWRLSEPLDLRFKGKTEFQPAATPPPPDQLRRHLIEVATKQEVAHQIEALMLQKPRD